MNIHLSLILALQRMMASEAKKTNGALPGNYLQRYNEDSFLFTSESVGEGHPGKVALHDMHESGVLRMHVTYPHVTCCQMVG